MRLSGIVFLLSILIIACHNSPDRRSNQDVDKKDTSAGKDATQKIGQDCMNSPFDTIDLLTDLFAPDTIINRVALWTPDKDAEYNINVSDDGYCHTNIDTIFKIPERDPINRTDYLVVFTTIQYDEKGEVTGCHSCGADYGIAILWPETISGGDVSNLPDSTQANAKCHIIYRVHSFKRCFFEAGCWGEGGEISLVNFGNYILHVSSGYTGTGTDLSSEDYYDITTGSPIFSYLAEYSTELGCDTSSGEYEEITKNLVVLPPRKYHDWCDLKLRCKSTRYDTILHKSVDSTYNEYYRMDEARESRYEKIDKI